MKRCIVYWLGLLCGLAALMAACADAAPVSETQDAAPTSASAESASVETGAEGGPRMGDLAPDFTLPDSDGTLVSLADELRASQQVVLIFYFGYSCPPCMAQLVEIEKDRAKYEEMGAQVLAIAVQTESGAKSSVEKSGASFPILADRDRVITEAYGVENGGLSNPSVFLINREGHVVWKEVTIIEGMGCGQHRTPSQTILDNLS